MKKNEINKIKKRPIKQNSEQYCFLLGETVVNVCFTKTNRTFESTLKNYFSNLKERC